MSAVLLTYLAALLLLAAYDFLKVRTIPDLFTAKRSAGALLVAGSLVATILGGSAVIGAVDSGPRLGWSASWFMLTGALGLAVLLPLCGRVRALGTYSLIDLVERFYGKGPRAAAAVVIPVAWTGIAAAQIIAAAKLLMTFSPLSYTAAALTAAGVFTLYTAAGGQKSVLKTDLAQCLLILSGLLVIALFALKKGVYPAPGTPEFPFNRNFTPMDLGVLILTYSSTFTVGPDIYSRLFCAKSGADARRALTATILVLIPAAFLIGYLAACGASLSEPRGALITELAKSVLPPAFLPLVALCLVSVVLSSADTTLLSGSVILCQLVFRKLSLAKARLVIVLNALAALALALKFSDVIGTLLFALSVYAGAFIVPVLWGLAGRRTKPLFVTLAVFSGGLLALAGKLCPDVRFGSLRLGDLLLVSAFLANFALLAAGRERKESSPRF